MLKSTRKMEERMQKLATVFETLANCGNMKERQGSVMRNQLGLDGKVMEK
jgi:hypothetical protein